MFFVIGGPGIRMLLAFSVRGNLHGSGYAGFPDCTTCLRPLPSRLRLNVGSSRGAEFGHQGYNTLSNSLTILDFLSDNGSSVGSRSAKLVGFGVRGNVRDESSKIAVKLA